MNINIRGDKIKVTQAIKNYIMDKMSRLDKYFEEPNSIDVHVLIRAKNNIETIEVTIPTNKYTLRAEQSAEDLYAAIDLVIDVLERQIRKNKTKLNNRKKADPDLDLAFLEPMKDDVKEDKGKIVKRKTVESKPMSIEEAVLQMELIDHDFFIYDDVDEECTAVVYKRKDGNYGVIYSK